MFKKVTCRGHKREKGEGGVAAKVQFESHKQGCRFRVEPTFESYFQPHFLGRPDQVFFGPKFDT